MSPRSVFFEPVDKFGQSRLLDSTVSFVIEMKRQKRACYTHRGRILQRSVEQLAGKIDLCSIRESDFQFVNGEHGGVRHAGT